MTLIAASSSWVDRYWSTLLILVIVVTIVWGWIDGRRQRKASKQRYQQRVKEYRERLLNPDWVAFEEAVPEALIEMYADRDLIVSEDLEPNNLPADLRGIAFISEFHPVDKRNLLDMGHDRRDFAFAGNMAGDLFLLSLHESNKETGPVYFWTHEDDERYRLSDDLRKFLSSLKPLEAE